MHFVYCDYSTLAEVPRLLLARVLAGSVHCERNVRRHGMRRRRDARESRRGGEVRRRTDPRAAEEGGGAHGAEDSASLADLPNVQVEVAERLHDLAQAPPDQVVLAPQ